MFCVRPLTENARNDQRLFSSAQNVVRNPSRLGMSLRYRALELVILHSCVLANWHDASARRNPRTRSPEGIALKNSNSPAQRHSRLPRLRPAASARPSPMRSLSIAKAGHAASGATFNSQRRQGERTSVTASFDERSPVTTSTSTSARDETSVQKDAALRTALTDRSQ
eukprot:6211065-Pleurochrysis_carterae.AAC.5